MRRFGVSSRPRQTPSFYKTDRPLFNKEKNHVRQIKKNRDFLSTLTHHDGCPGYWVTLGIALAGGGVQPPGSPIHRRAPEGRFDRPLYVQKLRAWTGGICDPARRL